MPFLSWCSVSDAVAENVAVIEVVVAQKEVACKAFIVEVVAEKAAHFIIVALLHNMAGKVLFILELALVHIALTPQESPQPHYSPPPTPPPTTLVCPKIAKKQPAALPVSK